jgi:hypothetical protein
VSTILRIVTKEKGYNSGRTYYLQPSTQQEQALLLRELAKLSDVARKKAEGKTRFQNSQVCADTRIDAQSLCKTSYCSALCSGKAPTSLLEASPVFKKCLPTQLVSAEQCAPLLRMGEQQESKRTNEQTAWRAWQDTVRGIINSPVCTALTGLLLITVHPHSPAPFSATKNPLISRLALMY